MLSPLDLLPPLLTGAIVTIQLTLLGSLLAILMAFLAGLARLSRYFPIRLLSAAYVEIFRGSSALVQVFFFFYVLPVFGLHLTPMIAGVLTLGLNFGAYGSEIVRSAICAIDRGQTEAATVLNMSPLLAMRRIIIPQAVIIMLPSFGNLLIELLKATALVSIITLQELTFSARLLIQATGRATETYTLALLLYLLLALPLTKLTGVLEQIAGRGFSERGAHD